MRHRAITTQLALVGADRSTQAQRVLSPKRPYAETSGMADVFPYYAGFSYDWARDQLASLNLKPDALVLDPWNGSGTTTLAAQSLNFRSIGVDLNPIANIVASLRSHLRGSVEPLKPPAAKVAISDKDPLLFWFTVRTARRLRQWAAAAGLHSPDILTLVTVCLFRIVRRLTKHFEGSNPTWVRMNADDESKVDLSKSDVDALMMAEQALIQKRFRDQPRLSAPSSLLTASATSLPIKQNSVNAIVTSPPYLTRIDYAVAYSRELAIVGVDIKTDRLLRTALMGTTLIRPDALQAKQAYGATASSLVKAVAEHPSKASGGYYLKQTRQYLDDLLKSLDEVTRVCARGAVMKLVVQDSYYKDIHVPLADICTEEAVLRGWKAVGVPDSHEVKRHLTQMNTAARAYVKGKVSESVITLRRP